MTSKNKPFWEHKKLHELSSQEWESLCDGCAQCCQLRYQGDDSEKITVVPVACELLDLQDCRCTQYRNRTSLKSDCIKLNPENVNSLDWLPDTCAYKLVDEGKPLFDWHPLISGNRKKMEESGICVSDRAISARNVHPDDLDFEVLKWVE